MESIYMRNLQRITDNLGTRTDIVKHAIMLDKYKMMNTSYAKQVFSIFFGEVISYLSGMLQVKISIVCVYMSQWHKFIDHWK